MSKNIWLKGEGHFWQIVMIIIALLFLVFLLYFAFDMGEIIKDIGDMFL